MNLVRAYLTTKQINIYFFIELTFMQNFKRRFFLLWQFVVMGYFILSEAVAEQNGSFIAHRRDNSNIVTTQSVVKCESTYRL